MYNDSIFNEGDHGDETNQTVKNPHNHESFLDNQVSTENQTKIPVSN